MRGGASGRAAMVLVSIEEEEGRRGGFHLKEERDGESVRQEGLAFWVLGVCLLA